MNRRERELESEGRLAARRGQSLEETSYSRLRAAASRQAFRAGFEAERKLQTSETATPEQIAESQAAIASLKQWAAENL